MPISASWLEGKRKKGSKGDRPPWYRRFATAMTARDAEGNKQPWTMTVIHWVLIGVSDVMIYVRVARIEGRGPARTGR